MNRYVLKFRRSGNMRFLSHLDMQRLFKRAIKKADIRPAYTQGFNPHEIINIVHPLALGFETEYDLFEIVSEQSYEPEFLMNAMNEGMPLEVSFFEAKEIPFSFKNLSSHIAWSEYLVTVPIKTSQELNTDMFIMQDVINILKKDKKTKEMVEKDVKAMLKALSVEKTEEDSFTLRMIVRSASNETLNPVNLTMSFLKFSGLEAEKERLRVLRTGMYAEENGKLISLYELN